jgi:O-antigen chain-terminating methyltransferase
MSLTEQNMELFHQTTPDSGPALVLQRSDGAGLSTVMPLNDSVFALKGRFADFTLVRPFVRALLANKPESLTVDHLCDASADLVRFALALNIRVTVRAGLDEVEVGNEPVDQRWGHALLAALQRSATDASAPAWSDAELGYEQYALSSRNHNLLIQWADRVMPFFEGKSSVLDVGSGTGIFLDQLARRNIAGRGIDNNPASVRYASMLGLDVQLSDARAALSGTGELFDAIHCSHFVEHLPMDALTELMSLIANALAPGGRLVLVFPDPESIRSQLLGFWRDPDHVRFYHPDIVETMALSLGLEPEFNSQREEHHLIAPFSMAPPEPDTSSELYNSDDASTEIEKRMQQLEKRVAMQEEWIRQLWAVNQTWAWSDDAVMTFLKPGGVS